MDKNFYAKRRILITGAAGNIGSMLARGLAGRCASLALTDMREPAPGVAPKGAAFYKKDITKGGFWRGFAGKFDTIFHLAAQTNAYRSSASVPEDWSVNVKPVAALIDLVLKTTWRPDVVFASTATVIGMTRSRTARAPARESPATVYDLHKFISEKYFAYYAAQLGGKAVSLRLSNVYGPGGCPSSHGRGMVNMMIRRAIDGLDLELYGSAVYVRDYTYIDDVVNAFIYSAPSIGVLNGKSYFIGTGKGHTIRQLAEKIVSRARAITGVSVGIRSRPFPKRAFEIEKRSFVADIRGFIAATGWKPSIDLDLGIELTARRLIAERQ
jgi:nucleoside-diphosphate-sugar epimerase